MVGGVGIYGDVGDVVGVVAVSGVCLALLVVPALCVVHVCFVRVALCVERVPGQACLIVW